MKIEEYKSYIETMLGAPIIDLETNLSKDMLEKIIKAAFMELRDYIDTPYYKTVAYPGENSANKCAIDLSEDAVRAVLYVTRGTISFQNASANTDALLWSPLTTMMTQSFNMGYYNTYSTLDFLQDYTASLRYRQLRNALNQDLDFTYDAVEHKLYLYQQVPTSTMITVVYNKEFKDVEEIQDSFWVNLMLRLAIAYTKQVLGRIRGKYRMSSAPYELDSDTLLSEANTELSEIRAFLNENNNIFIPRD